MSREERDIQNFIKRIQPSIRYFYRAAYAVTADRQMAEYVLGSALVDSYLRGIAPSSAKRRSLSSRPNRAKTNGTACWPSRRTATVWPSSCCASRSTHSA